MCYSAMAQLNAKKLAVLLMARVQTQLYEEIFERRLTGEKLIIAKGMEESFLKNPQSKEDEAIAEKIKQWHSLQIGETEKNLFAQKKRSADAERTLQVKTTKKAENELRIATAKIEKLKKDLEKHKNLQVLAEADFRIFPKHYISVVVLNKNREKVVVPMRYQMRPSNKDEAFDSEFEGCYNARFDSIDRVEWWRDALGKRHGIILVKKFYENVPTEKYLKNFDLDKDSQSKKNIVLCFEPENTEDMYIPVLWDVWRKKGEATLYSCALITDEPAPEIARAGHDRTPVFLKKSAVDSWLNAQGAVEDIKKILQQRENPGYKHAVFKLAQ